MLRQRTGNFTELKLARISRHKSEGSTRGNIFLCSSAWTRSRLFIIVDVLALVEMLKLQQSLVDYAIDGPVDREQKYKLRL